MIRMRTLILAAALTLSATSAFATSLCKTNTYDGGVTRTITATGIPNTSNPALSYQCPTAAHPDTCVYGTLAEQAGSVEVVTDNPDILKHQDLDKKKTVIASAIATIQNGYLTYVPIWKPEQDGGC